MKPKRGDTPEEVKNFIVGDTYLHSTYSDIYSFINYDLLPKLILRSEPLKIVEIGAAGGISGEIFQNLVKTDVVFDKDLNVVCSASNMPFKFNSVDVMILKDSFHHLPDIKQFLSDAMRILKPGANIYIIDPNWNFLSQFVYTFFHPEPFIKSASEWATDPDKPWHSNQALLWIVFKRDREILFSDYPNLKVEDMGYFNGISYILSGGVYSRTKIPSNILLFLNRIETRYQIIFKHIAISKMIKITKL